MPTFVEGEEDHDSALDLTVGTARVFVSSRGDGEIESAGALIKHFVSLLFKSYDVSHWREFTGIV